jgi:hypothetical protein
MGWPHLPFHWIHYGVVGLVFSLSHLSGMGTADAGGRQRPEAWYQRQFCRDGITEHRTPDGCRVDCLLQHYAIEVEFASKWPEAVGQSLYYAQRTGRQAGIVLIIEKPSRDEIHLQRLRQLLGSLRERGIRIGLWTIMSDGAWWKVESPPF